MKDVLIIGAGVAGLTAGIYARRSGLGATILEQHSIPGGMCTSWRRKGYLFEGAMHWMTGSSPKTALHALWRDVGALGEDVRVRCDEPFRSAQWQGQTVYLYRDLARTERHFCEVSPQDAGATKRLVADIRAFCKMQMPVMDLKGVKLARPSKMPAGAMLKMLPLLPKMAKLGKMPIAEYVGRFSHPALRLLLGGVVPDEDFSVTSLLFTLATLAAGDGGYPEGGSLAMTQRMADTFTGLGGKILYGAKADKVLVQGGAVIGLSVSGEVMPADAVIVTQETLAAAAQLFKEAPRDEWLQNLKRDTKPVACCFVGLGVREQVKEIPAFMLDEPIRCGGCRYDTLGFNCYADYPGYAPEGCTALTTALMGDSFDYWQKARDEGRYEAEKQAVLEQVCRALCRQHPRLEGKIEVRDLATPLTYERYTGASRGSWMAGMGGGRPAANPCTLEGAKGVYFAGHRTMAPGGLPVALMSGRAAAQLACRQFDAVFV